MKRYEWNEAWNTGVEEIDGQNRHLLGLAERLAGAIERSNDLATLASVLEEVDTVAFVVKELVDYASYHFAAEERYMRACGYPEYDRHREEHIRSARKMRDLEALSKRSRDRFSLELADCLEVFWDTHVLELDQRLGEYLRTRGVADLSARPSRPAVHRL